MFNAMKNMDFQSICMICVALDSNVLAYSNVLLLLQMSPADIQWVGEDPGVNRRQGFGGSGNGMRRSVGRGSVPGVGKGRGTAKGQSRKDFLPSQNGIGMKTPDDIQILHTDTLVKEVTENSSIVLFEIV